MNRVHISFSEVKLQVTPLCGPVRLLHLGDRGHHKVNKEADMAHWVMRTMKPSLACPWFGLALKTTLDARQQGGAQYEELLSRSTGGLAGCVFVACILVCPCLLQTRTNWLVCSASDGKDVRACARGQDSGQGQVQNGTSAACLPAVAGD